MGEAIEWIKLCLSILSFIVSIAMFVYVRSDRQQRATVKSITELSESVAKRFNEKCNRISYLEAEFGKIPTRAEFDAAQERGRNEIIRIHTRIDEINEGIKQTQLMLGELYGMAKAKRHD